MEKRSLSIPILVGKIPHHGFGNGKWRNHHIKPQGISPLSFKGNGLGLDISHFPCTYLELGNRENARYLQLNFHISQFLEMKKKFPLPYHIGTGKWGGELHVTQCYLH